MAGPYGGPPPLLFLVLPAAVVLLLLLSRSASLAARRLPTLTGKRIVLLIAHPDDEAMFFAPTVLGLTAPERANHVKILCLSAGDAAGLGDTRKRELVKSGLALGLKGEDDVFVVDTPDFPDSMTTTWDARKISALLCSAFAPRTADAEASRDPGADVPAANIDVLITFDARGVSAHPNHISLYHGARAFQAALAGDAEASAAASAAASARRTSSPVDLYTLRTVGVLRKYSGWVDVLTTLATRRDDQARRENKNDGEDTPPRSLVFTNQILGEGPRLGTAWAAMTTAHRSQMVWFRYLWLGFSRYMLVNDLLLEADGE